MRLKRPPLLVAAAVAILSACATPPGKLKDTDFVSRTVEVQQSVAPSVGAFLESLRYCGPESRGILSVTHHGVPNCAPPRSDGTVVCDLYVGGVYGGRSNVVLGRADFSPTDRGTTVVLRVQTYAANKEAILTAWENFLCSQAQQVCPER